ncbi:MAG: glycosyltransferase family protein [Planctomycetota bacterium]
MKNPMRIFMIADFKDESPKAIRVPQRMWVKGLLRLGHDVQRFSYRNTMIQCSPFPSKRLARYFAKKKTDSLLLEQIRQYHPNIIFVDSMKYLDAETVIALRDAGPDAVIVSRDEDPYPEKNPSRIKIARQSDIVITTSAGRFLQTYKDAGVPCCAFIPNMCDPDIQHPYEVEEKWKSDIVFTGKAEHKRLGEQLGRDFNRYSLLKKLSTMPNVKMYGCFEKPRVEGIEVFYAISGAKIALSINIVNDVRLYHSDRLVNCLSCGTFVLAKRVPDTDLLFQDAVHLKYFDSADEFFELADWYLKHETEREGIARAGMEKAHKDFSCERIAQYVLELVEKGTCDAPWAEVL